ncbi:MULTISPECIES: MinD/ParA family protein [Spirulina sp. CCY15215]|uniref:MinD/ParA family ATP-binding protein n=1 Tax=Spirulina sp. CCY15215 TaxID=2767591 RepID=UPI0019508E78|nr:MinD/ParA family protein [Spirulina major]
MGKIVTIHSYRGGTGKSNIAVNIAANLASLGQRVGLIDTDLNSPGAHILFDIPPEEITPTLNDYLRGDCTIIDTIKTSSVANLYFVPASPREIDVITIAKEGFAVEKLVDGCYQFMEAFDLDYLFIDTHPGLHQETLLLISISDLLIIVLRPDEQDFQGTAVMLDIARDRLGVACILLLNFIPSSIEINTLQASCEKIYRASVLGFLPHSEAFFGSKGIFSMQHRDHDISQKFQAFAEDLSQLLCN